MVSNGYSKRRGPLRRPKVCLASPNPGRCHPPPPTGHITCSLYLAEPPPYEVGENITLGWEACNTDFPEPVILHPVIEAVIGEVGDVEDAENCSGENGANYNAPEDPGTETLTLTITWSDQSQCQSVLVFEVTEEPEEPDD